MNQQKRDKWTNPDNAGQTKTGGKIQQGTFEARA